MAFTYCYKSDKIMSFKDKFYVPFSTTMYVDCETNSLIEDTRVFGILIYRKVKTMLYRQSK